MLLSTHTFRRSGASELVRRGVTFAEVMQYGRWLSDKSAREYIRTGELALQKILHELDLNQRKVLDFWTSLLPRMCDLSLQLGELLAEEEFSTARINQEVFERFVEIVKLFV